MIMRLYMMSVPPPPSYNIRVLPPLTISILPQTMFISITELYHVCDKKCLPKIFQEQLGRNIGCLNTFNEMEFSRSNSLGNPEKIKSDLITQMNFHFN